MATARPQVGQRPEREGWSGYAATIIMAVVVLSWTGWSQAQGNDQSLGREAPASDPALTLALREAVEAADSFTDPFTAEVWLVDMSARLARHIDNPAARLELLRAVHREASLARLNPELVLALIEVESAFDRFAVSSAGAQGLMQVMPFWKEEIGHPEDNLMEIDTNLRYGCTILRHYLEKERGDITRALARYNGSLNRYWYPERVMRFWDRHWEQRQAH